jgi:hypothetical protein
MLDRPLNWAARRLKAVAGWVVFQSGLFNRLRRDEAVIVLFHRVNDTATRRWRRPFWSDVVSVLASL